MHTTVNSSKPTANVARHHATFRFYEELNDFLPPERRKTPFEHAFTGTPSIKDTIEALGVPHVEIDLIIINDVSVGFDHLLQGGERVAVYPMFERLDITPLNRLRPLPLRQPRFILDVHLGKLARYLRLLGFDTLYQTDYDDATIVAISVAEQRIILTRDKGLLKRRDVTRGHWLRNIQPRQQLIGVIGTFDLRSSLRPFTRCTICNSSLERLAAAEVRDDLPAGLRDQFEQVTRCRGCRRLYWPGSHYDKLVRLVRSVIS